jgi:Domain of unknown function (DUF4328)/TIR domain
VTCDVLLSFAPEDAPTAEALMATLEREGWRCAKTSGGSSQQNDGAGSYRAVALILSERALRSPFVLRDTERAAGHNVPIFPFRLDDVPLSRSFEYFVGANGAASVTRGGFDAAATRLCLALRTRLTTVVPEPTTSGRPVRVVPLYDAAPPFRPRPVLRRSLDFALAIMWVLALAGLAVEAAGLRRQPNYPLIRTLAQLSTLSGGFCLYLLLVWFHSVHRNLLALGVTGLRHRWRAVLWRLLAFPLTLVTAFRVIRELQDKTPGRAGGPWQRRLSSWSWNVYLIAYILYALVEQIPDGAPLMVMVSAAHSLQMLAVPLLWSLIRNVSRRQAEARATRVRSQYSGVGEKAPGSVYAVLVGYAPRDRPAAEVLCEALEMRGVDCWLARRDASWDERAIERFGALIVVVSANLEGSAATLRELELAVAEGKAILPFRLDQSPVPAPFRYLLGSIHWFDDQGSDFDQQTAIVLQALRRQRTNAVLITEQSGAEDYRLGHGTTQPAPPPRSRFVFHSAAGVHVCLAVFLATMTVWYLTQRTTSADLAIGYFVTVTTVRVFSGLVCATMFLAWRRAAGEPAGVVGPRWLWPHGFVASTFGGLVAAVAAARFGNSVALVADLAVGALNFVALIVAVKGVRAATARQSREWRDVEIAARLKARSAHEPVRFDSQTVVHHWMSNLAVAGSVVAILLSLIDVAILDDLSTATSQDSTASAPLAQVLTMQVMIVILPNAILFMVWLGVAYRNLQALGVNAQRYTAAGAVLRFLNPLVNVALAVPIVNDLWRASTPRSMQTAGPSTLVLFWWISIVLYWTALWVHVAALGVSSAPLIVGSTQRFAASSCSPRS